MSIGDANVTCGITVSQPGCSVSCNQFGSSQGPAGNFTWSMEVETGTINIDWTAPNGTTPPLVIHDGETKQFTASFTWINESNDLPMIDLDGTVTAQVNGQTASAHFQIGAYSSAAGHFERPDTINFVISQNGVMSEGWTVSVPDVVTTFNGPTFKFSGLTPTGKVDDLGHETWNMSVSVAEDVIFELVIAAL